MRKRLAATPFHNAAATGALTGHISLPCAKLAGQLKVICPAPSYSWTHAVVRPPSLT
jgi:hypothetical protein